MKFSCCDKTSRQRNHTYRKSQRRSRGRKSVESRTYSEYRKRADYCRRGSSETVQQRNHLRHFNHLDFLRKYDADGRAEGETDIHRPCAADVIVNYGKNYRDKHADGAHSVADTAVNDVAHHCDTAKHAARKHYRQRKIYPIFCVAVKTHATDCCNKPCSQNARYRINYGLTRSFLLCNHTKHPVGYHKSAHNVYHSERDCYRTAYCRYNDTGRAVIVQKDGRRRKRAENGNAR